LAGWTVLDNPAEDWLQERIDSHWRLRNCIFFAAMAGKYGQVKPFEVDGGNFESYIERFEEFLKANSTTADLKSPMFISHVGA
jgi:hypothetical protein